MDVTYLYLCIHIDTHTHCKTEHTDSLVLIHFP